MSSKKPTQTDDALISVAQTLRCESARLRRALEEVLDLALTEELSHGVPLGYRLLELVGAVLKRRQPENRSVRAISAKNLTPQETE